MLGRSVLGEEEVPEKEHEVHEGAELDRPAVASTLRELSGPNAEVEANGDLVVNVVGYGIEGVIYLGDGGVHDSQGGWPFLVGPGDLRACKS